MFSGAGAGDEGRGGGNLRPSERWGTWRASEAERARSYYLEVARGRIGSGIRRLSDERPRRGGDLDGETIGKLDGLGRQQNKMVRGNHHV